MEAGSLGENQDSWLSALPLCVSAVDDIYIFLIDSGFPSKSGLDLLPSKVVKSIIMIKVCFSDCGSSL